MSSSYKNFPEGAASEILSDLESYLRSSPLDSVQLKHVAQKLDNLSQEANARSLRQARLNSLFSSFQQYCLVEVFVSAYFMLFEGCSPYELQDSASQTHQKNKVQNEAQLQNKKPRNMRHHEVFGNSTEIHDWLGID